MPKKAKTTTNHSQHPSERTSEASRGAETRAAAGKLGGQRHRESAAAARDSLSRETVSTFADFEAEERSRRRY
jgi:hypothetical protein